MAEVDFRNILPGQLNPDLTPTIGSPIARSSNIIDDPMSIYRRSIKNVFAPNVFDNVTTLRAIVLYVYQTPGQPILGSLPLKQRSKADIADANSVHLIQYGLEGGDDVYVKCMIPEVHLQNPNPFEANDTSTFLNIADAFYPAYTAKDRTINSDCKGLMPGSIVEVRFDDPNRSIGYVSTIVHRATNHILGDLVLQNSARGAFGGDSPTTTPFAGIDQDAGAAYNSTREQFATAQELLDAYPQISPELANKIVEVGNNLEPPVDPAWLSNVINFETGYTFDASTTNEIGATGLIQFLGSTAENLGTTTEDLAAMSDVEQMEFVEKYFQQKIDENGPIENANDAFMAVFYPPAMGKGPNFSIYNHASRTKGPRFAEAIRRSNRGITRSGQYTDLAFRKSRVLN